MANSDHDSMRVQGAADANALAAVIAAQKGKKLPPVHLWNPPYCGEIDMRIARDGTWYYLGSPIGRKPMVKLFSSVLRRDDDDRFYLVTPVERIGIVVDDAPFVAVELFVENKGPNQTLTFRTHVDDYVTADQDHPIWVDINPVTEEPSPYIRVRSRLDALINRPVFYELVGLAEERAVGNATEFGVWSARQFFKIGRVPLEVAD